MIPEKVFHQILMLGEAWQVSGRQVICGSLNRTLSLGLDPHLSKPEKDYD